MFASFYNTIIKSITILIIVLLSLVIKAEEYQYASNCGMTSKGVVNSMSWEICEEDISFLMFYKLFPDVFDELIFPFVKPQYLTNVRSIESENLPIYQGYQSSILKIFSSLSNLSLILGGFFLLWYSSLALLRTATDGEFLGSDWSTPKTLIKYGIIAFLLIPVSYDLIIMHLIILTLVLFSIAFANFIYSAYLSYVEVGYDATDLNIINDIEYKEDASDKVDFLNKKYNISDHNYFYASEHAKNLLKISLCKIRTEQYYQKNLASSLRGNNLNNALECNNAEYSVGNIDTNNNRNSFIWKKEIESNIKTGQHSNAKNAFITQRMIFGKYKENTNSCGTNNNSHNYNCGSLTMNVPIIRNNKIEKLMSDIDFYSLFNASINSITSASNNQIAEVTQQGWQTVYSRLIDNLANDQRKFTAHNEYLVKTISYIYHQLVLNELLINHSIDKDLKKMERVSEILIAAHCVDNYEEIQKSKAYNRFAGTNRGDFSTVCLKENTSNLIHHQLNNVSTPSENSDVFSNNKIKEALYATGRTELAKIMEEIILRRKGVELSMFQSLRSVSNGSLVQDLRKKGWSTIGGYALKLSKELELDNKIMHTFRSSLIFNNSSISENMINAEVMSFVTNAVSPENDSDFKDLSNYYSLMIAPFASSRSDLRADINVSNYTQSFFTENIDETLKHEDFSQSVLGFLSNPLSTFKFAIGMSAETNLSVEMMQMCYEDLSKCPVPLENPLVKLTSFGHELVNVGSSIITAAIIVSFIGHVSNTLGIANYAQRSGGSVNRGVDKSEQMIANITNRFNISSTLNNLGSAGSKIFSLLSIVDVILNILLPIASVMISVGIFFAYIIPLIPYIAFTMAFLAWIVLTIELLVIAPIWLVFSLRLVEKGNTSSEHYRAAFNFGLQILFRPALITVGFLLAWSLFSIFFMVVGFTIVPFLLPLLSGEYGVLSPTGIIDALLAMLTYGVIIYIVIKLLFNLMERLPNNIFSYVGVTPMNDSQSTARTVMENAVMATVLQTGALKSVADKSRDSLKSKLLNKKMEKEEEQRKLEKTSQDIMRKEQKEKGN